MSDRVDNGAPNPANSSGGTSPMLDELYATLGGVQAGLDARAEETDEAKKRLLSQEADLVQERAKAQDEGDEQRFRELTEQLEQLWQTWMVMTDEETDADDAGQPEVQPGDGGSGLSGGRDA